MEYSHIVLVSDIIDRHYSFMATLIVVLTLCDESLLFSLKLQYYRIFSTAA